MKFDIYFQIASPELQDQGKFFTFGTKSSQAVAGPVKLLNRWIKCLMTLRGTDASDPTYGTTFANLYTSNISTLTDLQDVVALLINDCNTQIFVQDKKNFPSPDEKLQSATIVNFAAVGKDGFSVTILLTNAAGASFQFTPPALPAR